MALFRTFRSVLRQLAKADVRTGGQALQQELPKCREVLPYAVKQRTTFELPRNFVAEYSSKYVTQSTFASSLRRAATQRIIGGKTPNFSYLLAFVPFAFAGNAKDVKEVNSTGNDALNFIYKGVEALKTKDKEVDVPKKVEDLKIKERLGKESACAAVYSADYKKKEVAVKIMFNYSYPSNEQEIVKGFKREVALICNKTDQGTNRFTPLDHTPLPPHPNIVKAHTYFVDEMPILDDCATYPAALPCKYQGFGHNKTLFLVMEKYSTTLKEYTTRGQDHKQSLVLLAQLLEAIAHLRRNGVAHGDLKNDNILLQTERSTWPSLVLTDFGFSIFDKRFGLRIPYNTEYVVKGGNPALMAPEILNCQPGPDQYLNYDKADVWAAGALAYEIFGKPNPLYGTEDRDIDQVEPLTGGKYPQLDNLVHSMLQKEATNRISAPLAATCACLMLFSPWSDTNSKMPSKGEVGRWLNATIFRTVSDLLDVLATKANGMDIITEKHNAVELRMRLTFLMRTSLDEVMMALCHILDIEESPT